MILTTFLKAGKIIIMVLEFDLENMIWKKVSNTLNHHCSPSQWIIVMCRSWTIRSFWTNPYNDSRVTSPLKKRFVHFLVATHRDLHMLSQGNRNYSLNAGHVGNDPKIRIRRPSRKMNKSFLFPLATSTEPMQVTWKMIQRSVSGRWTNHWSEDSIGRRTKHWPEDLYPADERIVHLPIVHWPEDMVGRWTTCSSAGYRSDLVHRSFSTWPA